MKLILMNTIYSENKTGNQNDVGFESLKRHHNILTLYCELINVLILQTEVVNERRITIHCIVFITLNDVIYFP
jgi:hypothetical protein